MRFNMRVTATQLRILILVVNLLLALGVPSFALYGFFFSSASHSEPVEIVDVEKLRMRKDEEKPPGPNSPTRIAIVGTWLNQKTKEIIEGPGPAGVAKIDESTQGKEAKSGGALEPGPLGESWDYAFFILRSDPLDNLVTLKKKDPNAASPSPGAPGSTRSSTRIRTATPVRTKVGGPRKIGVGQPSDRITFLIRERLYKNDDLGVNFFIHSADANQFVYWMEDTGPNRKFALKYFRESIFLTDPEPGLRPPAEKPPEDGSEPVPEKKHFRPVPITYESQIENEYQDLLKGGKVGPVLQSIPSSGGTSEGAAKPGQAPPGGVPGGAVKPGGPPGVQRAPTEAEKKQLQDALKKIPAKDQQEIKKALQGGLK